MKNRIDQYGTISIGNIGYETPVKDIDDIAELKSYLNKGYIFSFDCSSLGGWEFKDIENNPATDADNYGSPIGKKIAYAVTGTGESGGHIMTLVGYDDNVWTDINGNGDVDDGEKGALTIANSWGQDQTEHGFTNGDGGFIWLAYDALNRISAVDGAINFAGRQYAFNGNGYHYKNTLYWLTAKKYYTPDLIGKFTINDNRRCDLIVSLGYSDLNSSVPTNEFQFAIFDEGNDVLFTSDITSFFNRAGWMNFYGVFNKYEDGTSYFDFSDLIRKFNLTDGKLRRWYLIVKDTGTEKASTIKNFELLDHTLKVIAASVKSILRGDVHQDGSINNDDYRLLYSSINSPETTLLCFTQKVAADVNGDSMVDENDVSYLNGFLSGTIAQLPSSVKLINCGYVNQDGAVDNSDFDLLYAHIYGEESTPLSIDQEVASDLNGDGRIVLTDASIIRRYTTGSMNKLPIE